MEREKKNTIWFILSGFALAALLAAAVILNETHPNTNSGDTDTVLIDNGDLKINWTRYNTYDIELEDSLTITKSGVYHITGSLTDGNIIVNVADGKVKLILDNVTISNSIGPAITCYDADDLVIELVGENNLSDGNSYDASYDEDVNGTIYSKADLTFQGDGTLNLTANYQDGVVSKDDLKFISGTYNITAADDGIRGKDSVYIVDGNFTITAKGDGIKSTNETTTGKGFVLIENGNITISSNDDGIHAEKRLIVENGTINIKKSYEGLEAQVITINGGNISIVSSDDGINAGGGSDTTASNAGGTFNADTNCILIINGGEIYINASGDGVDSNGYIHFNGGTVTVDGPTNNGNGALDAGAGIIMNGGTVIAVGASGMAETLGSSSSIYNVSIYFASSYSAGTKVEIKNSTGETIVSHTSAKSFNHMAVGTSAFKQGETYTIYVNESAYTTFTISSTITTVGTSTNNMNGGNAPGGNSMPGSTTPGGNRR